MQTRILSFDRFKTPIELNFNGNHLKGTNLLNDSPLSVTDYPLSVSKSPSLDCLTNENLINGSLDTIFGNTTHVTLIDNQVIVLPLRLVIGNDNDNTSASLDHLTDIPASDVDVSNSPATATPQRSNDRNRNSIDGGSTDATVLGSMAAKPKRCRSKAQLKKQKRQMANLRRSASDKKILAEDKVVKRQLRKKYKAEKNKHRMMAASIPSLVCFFPQTLFCLPI